MLWFSGEAKALEPYGDTVDDRVDPGLRRTAAVGSTYRRRIISTRSPCGCGWVS
ncbi:MAG: hypothetical protein WA622_17460 [Mycobacterium sp.]|uniref:hypothetical protein n=1 Tax=Mycobacterium sp. TaxID=1785 RepID=UPI003BB6B3CF